MTHAYDRICLDRAADTLGRMLDYSVYSLHYDIASMMDLFIASGLAALFEHGDIRVIAGMSGIELAYEVLERSGLSYDRTTPRHTISLSAEYWCGYALASIQWASAWSFDHVLKSFSAAAFTAEFGKKRIEFLDSLPLNISNSERTCLLIRKQAIPALQTDSKRQVTALSKKCALRTGSVRVSSQKPAGSP